LRNPRRENALIEREQHASDSAVLPSIFAGVFF
jgi:hypothetical protein